MARIEKYSAGIVGVIKHNIREFRNGKCPTNIDVDPSKKADNYYIIRRGKTAKDIEKYRKLIEKECFSYKRKNLVRANEVVCSLPKDCPSEQEKAFFEESFKYICSTLPMGEKCIFLAEVHRDEAGQPHLHVMYVPAIPAGDKHKGYEYRLCSDQLTRRSVLQKWHPNYQKWLDDAGIHSTVASGVTSGKGISVKSLKEITNATGITLDDIKHLKDLEKEVQKKDKKLAILDQNFNEISAENSALKEQVRTLEKRLKSKEHEWGDNGWEEERTW